MITAIDFIDLARRNKDKFKVNVSGYYYSALLHRVLYADMYISLWELRNRLFLQLYHIAHYNYDFEWIRTEDEFISILSKHSSYDSEIEVINALMVTYDERYVGCYYNLR